MTEVEFFIIVIIGSKQAKSIGETICTTQA